MKFLIIIALIVISLTASADYRVYGNHVVPTNDMGVRIYGAVNYRIYGSQMIPVNDMGVRIYSK
jgi:hypothetical protein